MIKKIEQWVEEPNFLSFSNHEIWRKCPHCGAWEDLRKSLYCPECKKPFEL